MNDIGLALSAALLAPAPSAPPPVDAALASAARYCEAMVAERKSSPPPPAAATVHSDGEVPDLIRRFAGHTMSRMFGVDSYTHFHARNGQIWVVLSQQAVACDIVVTAVPGGSAALGASFTRSLAGQGWQSLGSIPTTATNPLWRHRLVKRLSRPGSPNSGIRLNIQGLRPFPGDEEGVQMELSFMAFDNFQAGASPR